MTVTLIKETIMESNIILDLENYRVQILDKPIPVTNPSNGATVYFNYSIINKEFNLVETFAQFQAAAMEQAMGLNEALDEAWDIVNGVTVENSDNVVSFDG